MKRRNLVGHTFNKLTALRFDHKGRHGLSFYLFRCDCGEEKVLCGTDVSKGSTKSCGCYRSKYNSENHMKLALGEAAFNSLYRTYKAQSKQRGLCFELSLEDFKSLTKGNCKYCGIEPRQVWRGNSKKSSPYVYNGVDRVVNEVGYTNSNSVSCCSPCNKAKRDMSLLEFMAWIARLVKFNSQEQNDVSISNNSL